MQSKCVRNLFEKRICPRNRKKVLLTLYASILIVFASLLIVFLESGNVNNLSSNKYTSRLYSEPYKSSLSLNLTNAVVDNSSELGNSTGFTSATVCLYNGTLEQWNAGRLNDETNPTTGAYDPLNNELYVLGSPDGYVTIYNESNYHITTSYYVGSQSGSVHSIIYDPYDRQMYVLGNGLTVIDAKSNSVSGQLNNDWGYALAVNPNSGQVYDLTNGYVKIINPVIDNTVATYKTGFDNRSFYGDEVYIPWNNYLYISHLDNNITVLNLTSGSLETTINIGAVAYGMAYDPANRYVYVLDSSSNAISVINSSTQCVVEVINTGLYVYNGIVYNPTNNLVYVSTGNSVSAINSNGSIVARIEVGLNPYGIIVGSPNKIIYVVNSMTNTLSLVNTNPFYLVNLAKNGNILGQWWSVTFDNLTQSSNQTLIQFKDTNGTFKFAVSEVYQFNPTPLNGDISIHGYDIHAGVIFSRAYLLTFHENGLPSGYAAKVKLNVTTPLNQYWFDLKGHYEFQLTNGTYSYSVENFPGYITKKANGLILINGSSENVTVYFESKQDLLFWEGVEVLLFSIASLFAVAVVWKHFRKKA